MDGQDYYSAYWKKIESGESPYLDIIKVFIQLLKEKTEKEIYSGYEGDFYRTVTKNELKRALKENGIEASPHLIGKAVTSFLVNKQSPLYQDPEKPYIKTAKNYQSVTYTRQKIEELEVWVENIIKSKEDSQ